jgi:phosphoribosylglycinamide formyltransferase-1
VPVNDDDTADSLSARILEQEHIAYPEAIARVLGGRYTIRDRRFVLQEPGGLAGHLGGQHNR